MPGNVLGEVVGVRRWVAALAVALLLTLCRAAGASAAPAPDASGPREAPATSIAAPARAAGATTARLVTPVRARVRIDRSAPIRRVSPETSWSGEPTTLLVLEAKVFQGREWVRLLLPERPNGSSAWVPREYVVLSPTPYWIEVSTGHRRLTVYRDGHAVRHFRAVVGKPSTPTPHGLAAIYERNRQPDPHAFLGTWVLALTAESDVLKHFEGGTGRVGIHGRAGASLFDPLGSARSHGCIRIDNGPVNWIAAHVPVGTPVDIR
jgi:lipoprotein-anchoring transpeptidase ErfK/SrfK